ncbi:MAG TPA: hypothetical protein VGX28_01645 [Frankiaceae bacterium]|nr:hypothetical protein [Frankiaceae bacterium]
MRRTSLLAATALALGTLVAATPAGAADDANVELPLESFSDMAVDVAQGRVFVSGDGRLFARDLAGKPVGETYGYGMAGIALSPDGTRVYAAIPSANVIEAYSATTLDKVASYPTGDATCPRWLSAAGDSVWFGYGCSAGDVGLLDVSAETPVVTLARTPEGTGLPAAPRVEATADGGHLVAAASATPSPVRSFAVTGGTLSADGARDVAGALKDLALTPDGTRVVTAATSPEQYQRFLVAGLADDGALGSQVPAPAAVAATDAYVAGGAGGTGDDVRVYGAGGELLRSYELGAPPVPGGLAFAPDGGTLFAVTAPGYRLRLHLLYDPYKHLPAMTLNYPVSPRVGTAFTLTGSLVGPAEGATVHVTRSSQYGTVALPDVVTGAGGAFSFSDTVAKRGGYTYVVAYDGDATWRGLSRGRAFAVAGLAPPLTITTDRSVYAFHRTAQVTARLGTGTGGRVAIYANAGYGNQLLKYGAVDTGGYLRVGYTITRRTQFTVEYAGNDVYGPGKAGVTRDAQAGLTTYLDGYYATASPYRVFRRATHPIVHAYVEPFRYGTCMAFEAQQYRSGAWRTLATNTCIRLDQGSRADAVLTGTHPVSVPHRVRVTFPGDRMNVRTVGPWLYLRFT